jgi:hypothetical protein
MNDANPTERSYMQFRPPDMQRRTVSITMEQREKAIHHVVHDYANFVSSAEMTIHGKHVGGAFFKPPINTHVGHAFYLNCRKMADFFRVTSKEEDDVLAGHYVSTVIFKLPVSEMWRGPINKQLAHITYTRTRKSREITRKAQRDLYKELKNAWREFLDHLPEPYKGMFDIEITTRQKPYQDGTPSEFKDYDLR